MIVGGGGNRVGGTDDDPIYDSTLFVCQQRASAGTFTVPTAVLAQLPAVQTDFLTGNAVGLLGLLVQPPPDAGRFTANLTSGGAVDFAYFQNGFGFFKVLSVE